MFANPDHSTLRELRETTAVESIVFLSAELLEQLMVLRLREPYLNLDDIRAVFGMRDGIFRREELKTSSPIGETSPLLRSCRRPTLLLRVRINRHQVKQLEESDVITRVSDVREIISVPGAAEQDV